MATTASGRGGDSTPPNSASDWLPGEALVASLQILLMDAPRLPDGSPDTSKVNITGEALLARAQQLDERSSYEGVVDLIQRGVLVPRGSDGQQGTFRLNLTLYALTPEERANLLRGQGFRLNSERLRQYAANLPARVAVARITAQDAKDQAAYRAAQPVSPPPVPPKPKPTTVTPPGVEVPPQPVSIYRIHQAALLAPPGAGTSPGSNTRNQQAASSARTPPPRADSLAGSEQQRARLSKRR